MTYIGLPILLAAYGEEALQRGGVLIGFMNPVMNAAAVLALTRPLKGSMDWRSIVDLRSILTNPVILACMVGLILSYFKIPFPTFAVNFLRFLSDLALPLALISMGGIFPSKRSRRLQGNRVRLPLQTVPDRGAGMAAFRLAGCSGARSQGGNCTPGMPDGLFLLSAFLQAWG